MYQHILGNPDNIMNQNHLATPMKKMHQNSEENQNDEMNHIREENHILIMNQNIVY